MHPKYLIVGISASALAACGGQNESRPGPEGPQTPMISSTSSPVAMNPTEPATEAPPPAATGAGQPTAGEPAPQPLSDGQIAAITDAANTGEIDQARVAERKARSTRVKRFAQMMIAHHTQAKQEQAELLKRINLTEAENPKSAAVRDESQKTLESLEATNGPDFDRAYIDVQVNQHQHVLDDIDNELIPNAKNADLRAALQDFRPKVVAHLQEARDIQQLLASAPSPVGVNEKTGVGRSPRRASIGALPPTSQNRN